MVVLLAPAAGCRRAGEIVLHQPFAPPGQQEMTLKSRWAYYAAGTGRQHCLLAFPRPTSQHGTRDFLIYFDAPDGTGITPVDRENLEAVRGFLIQLVGDLRGKCAVAEGTVRVHDVLLRPRLRRIDLDLHCDDDTRITGKAYVEHAPHELNTFQRRYALDVAALSSTARLTQTSDAGTEPRGHTTP
jgi:hypothetical protein